MIGYCKNFQLITLLANHKAMRIITTNTMVIVVLYVFGSSCAGAVSWGHGMAVQTMQQTGV